MISRRRECLSDSIGKIIERLGDFWSSCAQLRSQLTFLAIKYPLNVQGVTDDDHGQDYLKATATIMLPVVKGKALITFLLDKDTYTRWPLSIQGLKVDAQVAYGNIQYVQQCIQPHEQRLTVGSQRRGSHAGPPRSPRSCGHVRGRARGEQTPPEQRRSRTDAGSG